ncbi:MAG: hypothetical protein HY238_05380 [Acidobacteria bacterium]|nr:hypothetical protein [Acidobacteriota bacterium]
METLRWAQQLAYRTSDPLWWSDLAAMYATGEGTQKTSFHEQLGGEQLW